MLLSMTGYGDARCQTDRFSVSVEARAVNNRYLKIVVKCPDAYASLESEIEKVVRESIARGTVNIAVRIDRAGSDLPYAIDRRVLEGYWRQLVQSSQSLGTGLPNDASGLLVLPGVITEQQSGTVDREADWLVIREALVAALHRLQTFRQTEGLSMKADLLANARLIAGDLDKIATMAPQVVRDFRDRLQERVRELLQESSATVGASDLIREVSIFADRCDINEEITRLRSHLEQFEAFLEQSPSAGRKLEFLSQEMFREVNTIGSKANHVPIAHAVVEMKSAVEKIREVLQNVE